MKRARPVGALGPTAAALVSVLLAATLSAQAGISWTSTGAIDTQVLESPVRLEAGTGATNSRYVKDFQVSANKTGFTGEVKAKAGADMTLKDLIRAHNADDAPRTVTLRAAQTTNAQMQAFTFTVRNETSVVAATLDYKAASPSATFTLPVGATYQLDLRIDLADGAGKNSANVDVAFTMELT